MFYYEGFLTLKFQCKKRFHLRAHALIPQWILDHWDTA